MQLPSLSEGKRFWTTMVAILTPIAWFIGVLTNIPDLVLMIASKGPSWLKNPTFWWCVIFFLVEAVVITWLCRQPNKSGRPRTILDKLGPDVPMRTRLLVMLLEDLQSFYICVLESTSANANANYVMNVLECVYPPRIKELLGEEVLGSYLAAMRLTAKKTKYVHLVCRAAIPIAEQAIWRELEKMSEEPEQAVQAASPLALIHQEV